MRRFADDNGREWTAVIGRASYGDMALLFSRAGSVDVLTVPLEAGSAAAGRDLLTALTDSELREHLARARPWGE